MGFTELLTIIFILLKVFGFINWSWWLVFLPEIIMVIIYIVFIICSFRVNRKLQREWKEFMEDDD